MAKTRLEDVRELQLLPSVSESHEQAIHQAAHTGQYWKAEKMQQHSFDAVQTEPPKLPVQQVPAVDERQRELSSQQQIPGVAECQQGYHHLQQQAAIEAVPLQKEADLQHQAGKDVQLLRQEYLQLHHVVGWTYAGHHSVHAVCRDDQQNQTRRRHEQELKVDIFSP
jgi:hypothetical protein